MPKLPNVMSRTRVRKAIAGIVTSAAAGETTYIGTSQQRAMSAFVPLEDFPQWQAELELRHKPEDVEIDRLRTKWSSLRESVENTGRPLTILRNGVPAAMLVPTAKAMGTKVASTIQTLTDADLIGAGVTSVQLAALTKEVAGLRKDMDSVAKMLSSEPMRQLLRMVPAFIKAFRQQNGLPPDLPPED